MGSGSSGGVSPVPGFSCSIWIYPEVNAVGDGGTDNSLSGGGVALPNGISSSTEYSLPAGNHMSCIECVAGGRADGAGGVSAVSAVIGGSSITCDMCPAGNVYCRGMLIGVPSG